MLEVQSAAVKHSSARAQQRTQTNRNSRPQSQRSRRSTQCRRCSRQGSRGLTLLLVVVVAVGHGHSHELHLAATPAGERRSGAAAGGRGGGERGGWEEHEGQLWEASSTALTCPAPTCAQHPHVLEVDPGLAVAKLGVRQGLQAEAEGGGSAPRWRLLWSINQTLSSQLISIAPCLPCLQV